MTENILGDWLATGTVRREDVPLYADQALMEQMARIADRIERLTKSPDDAEVRAVGEKSELRELEEQAEELWTQYEASRAVFTVRALTQAEIDAIRDAHPEPLAPSRLPLAAPAKAKENWAKERDAFVKASQAAAVERDLRFIAKATVKVVIGKSEADSVTVEQVRAMRDREYGARRVELLIEAINRCTQGEVEMPRPFSSSTSAETTD